MIRKTALILTLLLLLTCHCQKPAAASVVNPYVTYSYQQMRQDITALEAAYPQLLRSQELGCSLDGRKIIGLWLGRGDRVVVICASIHGREHITTNFIMDMVERYCRGYVANGCWQGMSYREALDNVSFLLLPMLNPDGVSLAQEGLAAIGSGWRALTASLPFSEDAAYGYAAWKANIRGVDLNRNFPWKWQPQPQSPQPSSAYYQGQAPLSEPESQAVARGLAQVDYELLVSLHSMGQVVYWLDTDTLELYAEHYPLARRLAAAFGYDLLPPEDTSGSGAGGFLCNSIRYSRRCPCLTVELCPYIEAAPYPSALFDAAAGSVYPLGLLLAAWLTSGPAAE